MTLLPREGGAALTEQVFHVPDRLPAPHKAGRCRGHRDTDHSGRDHRYLHLIAGSDVSRNQLLYTLSRVREFFFQHVLQGVVMLTMLVIGAYLIFTVGRILRIWSKGKCKPNQWRFLPCWM